MTDVPMTMTIYVAAARSAKRVQFVMSSRARPGHPAAHSAGAPPRAAASRRSRLAARLRSRRSAHPGPGRPAGAPRGAARSAAVARSASQKIAIVTESSRRHYTTPSATNTRRVARRTHWVVLGALPRRRRPGYSPTHHRRSAAEAAACHHPSRRCLSLHSLCRSPHEAYCPITHAALWRRLLRGSS